MMFKGYSKTQITPKIIEFLCFNIFSLVDSYQFFDSMEDESKIKSNKCDIICNLGVEFGNTEELEYGYFESGSIYLGSKEAISQTLFEKGIGAVLTVMDLKSYQKQKIKERLAQFGLSQSHMLIETKDTKEVLIEGFFESAYKFIENNLDDGKNILVHCKGGMSRSPAILCSYLMKKYDIGFDKCYQFLKKRRSVVAINEGFEKQLRGYSVKLKDTKKV